MKTKNWILTMLMFSGLAALAQDAPAPPEAPHKHWSHLSQLDTDGDGRVSPDEFSAGNGGMFGHLDRNSDGYITESDIPAQHRRVPLHLVMAADADQSGDVAAAEWSGFLAEVTEQGSTTIDFEALHQLLGERVGGHPHPPRAPHAPHAPDAHQGEDVSAPRHMPGDINEDGAFDKSDLNQIFAQLDENGDGALSSEELPKLRHPQPPSAPRAPKAPSEGHKRQPKH
jgi:Ca2+-binding EF-hand superfamily protein